MNANTPILTQHADILSAIPDEHYEASAMQRAREIEEQLEDEQLSQDEKELRPKGYYTINDSLMYQPEGTGDDGPPAPIFISSRLDVTACTRNDVSEEHGRLLEFDDIDGFRHRWSMPMELLAGDGTAYREQLLSLGLRIAPGSKARQLLNFYIQSSNPKARARCVSRTGWHKTSFVLPDETIGSDETISGSGKERIILQTTSLNSSDYLIAGTLDEWKEKVASLCKGNSRLVFSVSVAFAAPLLNLLGIESGGFHFRGASSTGKTTALYVGASVWGGKEYVQRWRATTNGIEALAASHNDALLCLDELSQVDSNMAGEIAYMLANGTGKARADRRGNSRKVASWKVLFLSTGEISLSDHMVEAGKRAKAGQEVRMVDIPAVTDGYGLFEYLHGYPNGAAFSQALIQASNAFHGTSARAFLKCLIEDLEANVSTIKNAMDLFMKALVSDGDDGQVYRVARRFALVGAAGELATSFGITGWDKGDALLSAEACFIDWLEGRGGTGSQEEQAILNQLRRFFELHGDSRFALWDAPPNSKTNNRAGFRRIEADGSTSYFVLSQVFKEEVAAGFDYKQVCKVALKYKLLVPATNGEFNRSEKLPDIGSQRCYRFRSTGLEDADDSSKKS